MHFSIKQEMNQPQQYLLCNVTLLVFLNLLAIGTSCGGKQRDSSNDTGKSARVEEVVRQVDETHFEVQQEDWSKLLSEKSLKGARVVPNIKNGVHTGFKVYNIEKDSVLSHLGFEEDDNVVAVNQVPILRPEDALNAYNAVKGLSEFSVQLTRNGAPLTLYYRVL